MFTTLFKNTKKILLPIICFLTILLTFVGSGALMTLLPESLNIKDNFIYLSIIMYIIGMVIPVLILLKIFKIKLNFKINLKNIVLCFLLGMYVQPIGMFLSLIGSFFVKSNVVTDTLGNLTDTNFILITLAIAILPGICEELAFRGLILKVCDRNMKFIYSAILSSLLFGIMHFDIQQFIYTFALGIFLAYVLNKTKTITSTIIMHFTINLSQSAMAMALFKFSSEDLSVKPTTNELLTSTLTMGLLSLIIFAPLCFICYKFLDNNEVDNDTAKCEII